MSRDKVIGILIIILIIILAMIGTKIFLDNFQWPEPAQTFTDENTKIIRQGNVNDEVVNSDINNIIEELNKEEYVANSVHNAEISLQESSQVSQNKNN